jgi:subtilase family serine protease
MSSRRTVSAVIAAATLVLPASALAATSHGAAAATHGKTSKWAATHTQALDLGRPLLGNLAGHHEMHVSLGLALRHRAKMDKRAQETSTPGSAHFRDFLSPHQVRHKFGPRKSSVDSVKHWLRQSGFSHVSAESNRLLVDAQAPASTVRHAFDTRIEKVKIHGSTYYSNVKPAMVPASLGKTVTTVLGLSDLSMASPLVKSTSGKGDSAPDLTGFTPAEIAKVYDATSLPGASKTSDAVIAMGDMKPIIANLRTAEMAEGFPQVPVKVVYGGPKKEIRKNNPLTGNPEWDLDTQMATMEAKNVKRLYIYDEQTFTDEDVARGINEFVSADKAISASASLGECDYIAWADGAMLTTDEALEEGALQGQSLFASTGDNGSFCPEVASTGVPGGAPGTSWPADGTWTTAAGGTRP